MLWNMLKKRMLEHELTIKPGDTIIITANNDHGIPVGTVLIVIEYGWYFYRNGWKKEIPEYLDCLSALGQQFHIADFDCFEPIKIKGK